MTNNLSLHYESYVGERWGAKVLKSEYGFIVYKMNLDHAFIHEMFIDAAHRASGHGKKLLNELCEYVRIGSGLKKLVATIYIADKNHKNTLCLALLYGFSVTQANNGCLTLLKELGE